MRSNLLAQVVGLTVAATANAASTGAIGAAFLIAQARVEIGQPSNSARLYCSSVLGYTTPVVTTTMVTTTTPLGTQTTTGTQTDTITSTEVDVTTQTDTTYTSTTTTFVLPATTTNTEITSTSTTATLPTTTTFLSTTTISTETLVIPTTTVTTTTVSETATAPLKRDATLAIALPSVLSKYPAAIISPACSLAVSPETRTRTVTTVSTSTASTSFATQVTSTTTATTTTTVSPTTVNTLATITSTESSTTTSTTTLTETVTDTQTLTETPTVVTTSEVDVVSTTVEVPTITSTTLTTTTTTVAPAPTCGSGSTFAIQASYNSKYAVGGQGESSTFSFTGTNLGTAQIFRIDANANLVEASGAFAGFMAEQSRNVNTQPMFFASDARIKSAGYARITCAVDASCNLSCACQGNTVFGRSNDQWHLGVSVEVMTSRGLMAPITVKAVPV